MNFTEAGCQEENPPQQQTLIQQVATCARLLCLQMAWSLKISSDWTFHHCCHQGIFFPLLFFFLTSQILPNSPLKERQWGWKCNKLTKKQKKVNLHLVTPSKRDHTRSLCLYNIICSPTKQACCQLFLLFNSLESGGGAAAVSWAQLSKMAGIDERGGAEFEQTCACVVPKETHFLKKVPSTVQMIAGMSPFTSASEAYWQSYANITSAKCCDEGKPWLTWLDEAQHEISACFA